MPHTDGGSLWSTLSAAGHRSDRALWGADASVTLSDLVRGSSLGGRLEELRGCSVLVTTRDQLSAALALIELDAVARRLVLCPPDLPAEHLPFVAATAAVDALVSDQTAPRGGAPGIGTVVTCTPKIAPAARERTERYQTEWILLTSGTTGRPKMVVHTLASLSGAMRGGRSPGDPAVWSTFYDIRRYGGLQIFLRALLGGGSMVLSSAQESTADFLIRAGAHGVTHISGTPSHWRRALMSPSVRRITPRYVRLSGEIADQAILDHLRAFFPNAGITHAFASTEAGVAFDVGDGLAGFPASLIGRQNADVEMKVEDGSLRIRSARTASRYLGHEDGPLADRDGFVDTGDMLERRGDRYHFVGRRGGIINVGGSKVHPEEVEAVINGHPHVRMSLVRTRKNPITGALVVADVVLREEPEAANGRVAELEHEIMQRCRETLARHKVPAAIRFVSALAVTPSGKLVRHDA
ncbi:MAG: long-chain fatty acid--CoA ligase [Candidatus Rokuibacteriota bacterium]|nr:MAG: long-chain fatty acid--CoA ligase [Candidatus Rokubacteria bacterium]